MFSSIPKAVTNLASSGDHPVYSSGTQVDKNPASFDKQKLFNSRGARALLNSANFEDQPMFGSRSQTVMNLASSGDHPVYSSGTHAGKNPAIFEENRCSVPVYEQL